MKPTKTNFKQMKLIFLLSIVSIFSISASAQTAPTKNRMAEFNASYDSVSKLITRNYGRSLDYAVLLYKDNQCEKADRILKAVTSNQVTDIESGDYGLWAWGKEKDLTIGDKNVPLFHAHAMLVDLWDLQEKMSFDTRAAYLLSCKRLVQAAERRWDEEIFELGRDCIAYSNVFTMYVEVLTVASERFNDARLKRMANTQWIRLYNHFKFYGVDEFLSSSYDDVIFKALFDIHNFALDERMKRESKEMMDYVYLQESAVTHPLLKLSVVGMGRDYRAFQKTGDVRVAFLKDSMPGYVPPKQAKIINSNRTYPFEVVGKAGTWPFIFKSYQLKNAAMGSMSGGSYFWQQIHCMASVGKNENERATLFVPGTYTPNNGYTSQIAGSTLCVYNRLPTMWHITQWRNDLSKVKETMCLFGVGISNNWKEKKITDEEIVLEAYGYELHIFPFQLNLNKIEPFRLQLKQRTTTSPQYHSRPALFQEYEFPNGPEWFGVYIVMAESGKKVISPKFSYSNKNNNTIFLSGLGHEVKLVYTEQGIYKQIYPFNIDLLPKLSIESSNSKIQ
jgi:hypothetical protein